MRYKFMRFPGGKAKALTLSYDDGIRADVKLSDIITPYGLKCTFNINTVAFGATDKPNKLQPDEIKKYMLDRGHEVAVHGESHIAPGNASPVRAITDILNCRITLEKEFGMIIRGMAYPDSGIRRLDNGTSYENIRSYVENLGIAYSRTLGGDNNSFLMPTDWYAWMPTAHHNNANLLTWAEEFVNTDVKALYPTRQHPRLFYLWGHSYEFDNNDNWSIIEKFAETVSGKDDIWYATNIEIYEYTEAYNSLVTSADGSKIFNPTSKEIFLSIDTKEYSVKPGETLSIG